MYAISIGIWGDFDIAQTETIMQRDEPFKAAQLKQDFLATQKPFNQMSNDDFDMLNSKFIKYLKGQGFKILKIQEVRFFKD